MDEPGERARDGVIRQEVGEGPLLVRADAEDRALRLDPGVGRRRLDHAGEISRPPCPHQLPRRERLIFPE
jgi:hypothetical protein